MLTGRPGRAMLSFALPLIATGVLQQSFNSVDIAIAGRFCGHGALAAVGSNGPVIGLIINMFVGLAIGVNVVIANYIGQRNGERAAKAVGASAFLALVCGLFMLVISQVIARPILTLLSTPEEVLDDAVDYLRVIGLGMPFMLIYNFGAAVLRSVGDTRRPFYILVAAGLVNVGLNLLFVIGMGMGVTGVAWGTALSNVVNAVLIVWILLRERSEIGLQIKYIRPYRGELGRICRIGLPAGLQGTVFSISNVFILSAINSFGALAAAGSAAALNYEFYCYHVISAFVQTATAFTGQNYGAGQLARIRRIHRIALGMAIASSAALNLLIAWQQGFFLEIFTTDPGVLEYASVRITMVLVFQWIACYYEVTGGVMRGMGHSLTPAIIVLTGTCALRLLWVGFFPAGASFGALLAVYPVSWTLTNAMIWLAWRRIERRIPAAEAPEEAIENLQAGKI